MKKILVFILGLLALFCVIGCGSSEQTSSAASSGSNVGKDLVSDAAKGKSKEKVLVVYFSQPETDHPSGMSKEEDNSTTVLDGKVFGNVEYFAKVIQANTGADVFRIEPETPYTLNHKLLVPQAKRELETNARPAIKGGISLGNYDTIFLGYPNWWGDMPMVMYTFLDTYNLSGKKVIPFNVHGGSGFSNTINAIAQEEPHAKVIKDGLSISRDDMNNSEPKIIGWLKNLGYGK